MFDNGEGGGEPVRTTLTGVQVGVDVTGSEKVWRTFQAIGDIAFAYAYSNVLIEIQVINSYCYCNQTYGLHKNFKRAMHAYIYEPLGFIDSNPVHIYISKEN